MNTNDLTSGFGNGSPARHSIDTHPVTQFDVNALEGADVLNSQLHVWKLLSSTLNPCGCAILAKVQLSGLSGDLTAVIARAGSSNRTVFHHYECDRCYGTMLIVQNKSGSRRWNATAFKPGADLSWVETTIPADIVYNLLLDRVGVAISPSPEVHTVLCSPFAKVPQVDADARAF